MFIRAHAKSLKKAKQKLKELTSRSQGRNVRAVMYKVKVFIRGWLGYFYISSMRNTMKSWDEWLRRRFRMYIWKQWKLPRTRVKNLRKLGFPEWRACEVAYSQPLNSVLRYFETTPDKKVLANKKAFSGLAGWSRGGRA